MKEKEENMEGRILDCAERLFLRKGYALVSMTEIAREVGCNQALVHYYFRTKDNLFQKIFEEKVSIFFTAFEEVEDSVGDFYQRLTKKLEKHYEMMVAHRDLPFMLLNEMVTNPKQMESVKDKLYARGTAVFMKFEMEIQEEIKAGRMRQTTALDLTIDILCMVAGQFFVLPILEGVGLISEEDRSEFLNYRKEQIIEAVINGLKIKL